MTILCYFAGQEFNLVRSFTVAAASSPTSLLSPQLTALKGKFILQIHAGLVSPRLTALKGGLHADHQYVLCPFAEYFLRYAVTSFFTMSRISLEDGKRAGQKVHRKIAVAVQNVKPLYFLSRSFEIICGKRSL